MNLHLLRVQSQAFILQMMPNFGNICKYRKKDYILNERLWKGDYKLVRNFIIEIII